MARKTPLPKKEEFLELFKQLEERGFVRMTRGEIIGRLKLEETNERGELNEDMVLFRKQKSDGYMEEGYKKTNPTTKKTTIVWSSFILALGEARKKDFIWVELFDDLFPRRAPCFSSFPIRRYGKWAFRTLRWAECLVEITDHWPPPCTGCMKPVTIYLVRGKKEMHEVAFFCPTKKHPLPERSIYQGSSPENRKFMEFYFNRYSNYRKKNPGRKIFRFMRAGVKIQSLVGENVYANDTAFEKQFPEKVFTHKN